MPAMLNLGLFNIPQGVMPFPMNGNAFVVSFFALAFIVALVWVFVFHLITVVGFLSTLFALLKSMLSSMDGVLQGLVQARRKLLDTVGGGETGQDQRTAEITASTTCKKTWALRLKSIFQMGGRRTPEVQGEPV